MKCKYCMSKLSLVNHNIPNCSYALVDQNGGAHVHSWPLKVSLKFK